MPGEMNGAPTWNKVGSFAGNYTNEYTRGTITGSHKTEGINGHKFRDFLNSFFSFSFATLKEDKHRSMELG